MFTMTSSTVVRKEVDTSAAINLLISTCQKLSIGAEDDDMNALVESLDKHLLIVESKPASKAPDVFCRDPRA